MTFARCLRQCQVHREDFIVRRRNAFAVFQKQALTRWRRKYPQEVASVLISPLAGACGAISFSQVPPPQRKHQVGHSASHANASFGFCQMKAAFCAEPPFRIRPGQCTERAHRGGRHRAAERGYCSHLIGRLPTLEERPPHVHDPFSTGRMSCLDGDQVGCTEVSLSALASQGGPAGWRHSTSKRWIERTREPSSSIYSPSSRSGQQGSSLLYLEPMDRRSISVLGGGLNNMLMSLAQLLTESCERDAVLLLPPFDADPLARERDWHPNRTCSGGERTWHSSVPRYCHAIERPARKLAAFDDIFNLSFFKLKLARSCGSGKRHGFVVVDPPSGARVEPIAVRPLGPGWDFSKYARMFTAIYGALRPSPKVEAIVDALRSEAVRTAGAKWAAVHLPIEKDWWWGSDWCKGRAQEKHTQRCWNPSDVAKLTQRARAASTGTVLLFAHDKVATRDNPWYIPDPQLWRHAASHEAGVVWGPTVCKSDWSETTFKLALPSRSIPYIFRNAAEQFFAAQAPAGFFGNAYSTFSKGIALMRSATIAPPSDDAPLRSGSFAYDCARTESVQWAADYLRTSIVALHPGFSLLLPLSRAMGGNPNGARSYDDYCGNPFAGMDKRTIRARLRNGTALLFERKNE